MRILFVITLSSKDNKMLEPILNRVFRKAMRSFMELRSVSLEELHSSIPNTFRPSLLYIHVPFCESLCPYCSFHRCKYQENLAEQYFDALDLEVELHDDQLRALNSVYIGGGTPTIRLDLLIQLISKIRSKYPVKEISVETNPNHIERETLHKLRDVGVSRLSVGVQSFDDNILHHIGRLEKYGSGDTMCRLLEKAEGIIPTLNIDLIFNIPIQNDELVQKDIRRVIELGLDQVTFYPLMTAPSVEHHLKQMLGPLSYRKEQRQYHLIREEMQPAYRPSTAWCFSNKQSAIDEYLVDHEHYLGFGSGAFGYQDGVLRISTFSIQGYIDCLHQGKLPISHIKPFTTRERQYYCLLRRMFGLRCPITALHQELNAKGKGNIDWYLKCLKTYGALRQSGADYTLTPKGMYLWVIAMREFFIAVDTLRDRFRSEYQEE